MKKPFYQPILDALAAFEDKPNSTQPLYDTVESFIMDNMKLFEQDDNSGSTQTSHMYSEISEVTAGVKCFENVNVIRFIQAILFKEYIRKTPKLGNCTLKQFDEVLYYYSNRLGGTEYKNYQQEFTQVFYKVYLALDKQSRVDLDKYPNDENLTYRLKKLMRSAIIEVKQHLAGSSPVVDTFLKELMAVSAKPAPAKEDTKVASKPTSKTTAKKTTAKTSTSKTSNKQPISRSPEGQCMEKIIDDIKSGDVPKVPDSTLDINSLQTKSPIPLGAFVFKGETYSIPDINRSIRENVSFKETFAALDNLSLEEYENSLFVAIATTAAEGGDFYGSLIKETLFNQLMDQVIRPMIKKHTPAVDPMREQLDAVIEQVKNLQQGLGAVTNLIQELNTNLKKANK